MHIYGQRLVGIQFLISTTGKFKFLLIMINTTYIAAAKRCNSGLGFHDTLAEGEDGDQFSSSSLG